MQNTRVSVIALSYNQSRYLEETLDSILNKSYKNDELIICDHSSVVICLLTINSGYSSFHF